MTNKCAACGNPSKTNSYALVVGQQVCMDCIRDEELMGALRPSEWYGVANRPKVSYRHINADKLGKPGYSDDHGGTESFIGQYEGDDGAQAYARMQWAQMMKIKGDAI